MRKLIDGKMYNTETATFIGQDSFEYPGNFHYVHEELYRTKKGTYFLYGKGGPRSKYAIQVAMREWEGGSDICVLSVEDAKIWVEEHLSVGAYEEEFGTVEEG